MALEDFQQNGSAEESSWAARMEEEESSKITADNLPKISTTLDGNTKTVVEYSVNDGKIMKTTRIYRIERKKVSKGIVRRKLWGKSKFGDAEDDKKEGPDTATTLIADEVFLTLATTNNKEITEQSDENLMKKSVGPKMVACRICRGDHWTTKCPFKDSVGIENLNEVDEAKGGAGALSENPKSEPGTTGKYVPPSLRGGASGRPGETMNHGGRDDTATVRVTNLSEETKEQDLKDLFGHFGPIHRVYLAKDKATQRSKGFAFINYYNRRDAQVAITSLDGHGYDHLILKVEWAKPSGRD